MGIPTSTCFYNFRVDFFVYNGTKHYLDCPSKIDRVFYLPSYDYYIAVLVVVLCISVYMLLFT